MLGNKYPVPPVGEVGDIVTNSSVHMYVRMCNAFTVYTVAQKYWSDQLQFCVGTLGTLGQHEFTLCSVALLG